MREGVVIPFLGAGLGRVGRAAGDDWLESGYLPDGGELAKHLAQEYAYPNGEGPDGKRPLELLRVAQYVDVIAGRLRLLKELHRTFTSTDQPTQVHRYLAEQPARAMKAGLPNPWPIIITTNYDDLLELAFEAAEEPFDLITYSWRNHKAEPVFQHRNGAGEVTSIDKDDELGNFALGERTVILKIHGSVVRADDKSDSFVITEDDYIRHISKNTVNLLPALLVTAMTECDFLFLGYSLADWNLRAFLYSIWENQHQATKSLAICKEPDRLEERFWRNRHVELIDFPLELWVEQMLKAELSRSKGK
jgi:hypothetical protein